MNRFRTTVSAFSMLVMGLVGFYIGAYLNVSMNGAILFSMITRIGCIIYTLDNRKNKIIIQGKSEFSGEIVINKKLMSC